MILFELCVSSITVTDFYDYWHTFLLSLNLGIKLEFSLKL